MISRQLLNQTELTKKKKVTGSGAYDFKVLDGAIIISYIPGVGEGGERGGRKIIASQASLDLLLSSTGLTRHRS